MKVSYREAFCSDERFARSSWVNVVNMINHELTGINVIMAYSNTILTNILGDAKTGFNARQGSFIIAVISTLSTVAGIWTCRFIGRRTLLLWGHVGIAIAYFGVGLFTILEINYGVLGMMCFFLLAFWTTTGPVSWVYATETCCDTGHAACLLTLFGTVLILQLTTEPLMDSALKP